jgi:hypothetical protein
MAPDLQPYFTTGQYDDNASILQSYGLGYRQSLSRYLGGTPALVGVINAVVFGAIAALITDALGATGAVSAIAGAAAALVAAVGQGALMARAVKRGRGGYHPRFPSERTG